MAQAIILLENQAATLVANLLHQHTTVMAQITALIRIRYLKQLPIH